MKKVIIFLAFATVFFIVGYTQNDDPDDEEKEIIVTNTTFALESTDTSIVTIEGNSIKGIKEGVAGIN